MSQHLEALELANRIRRDGKQLKAQVRAGLPVSQALADPRAGAVQIAALLGASMGWGERRTAALLKRLHLAPNRKVRDISPRQLELIALVTDRHERSRRERGSAARSAKIGGPNLYRAGGVVSAPAHGHQGDS